MIERANLTTVEAGQQSANATTPADHRISYGDDPNQFGELRLPPQDGPHPVVVLVIPGAGHFEIASAARRRGRRCRRRSARSSTSGKTQSSRLIPAPP
jgi:hypothetical protein